jgi:hypothetical protein
MSSNRLCYDKCAYQTKLYQSTSPLDYALYQGKYENKGKCRFEFGVVGGNGVSQYAGNMVDLESELRGQTRLNSQCPSSKFCAAKAGPYPIKHQASCQMQYYPEVPVVGVNQMGGGQCNYGKFN